MIFLAFLIVAGIAAKPVTRAVKGFQARRLAHQARDLIDKNEWDNATKKARDAYRLRSTEPETWRTVALLLTRMNQGSAALTWWQKLADDQPLTHSERHDYAAAALNANDLSLAAREIDTLDVTKAEASPADLLLAAELATLRGDSRTAIALAERTLAASSIAPRETFNALVITFLNSQPTEPAYSAAVDRLTAVARNAENSMSLQALELIVRRPTKPRLSTVGTPPLIIVAPPGRGDDLISRTEAADLLDHHPKARPIHHLLALDIRSQNHPETSNEVIEQAIQTYKNGDDEAVAALGNWLYEHGRYQTVADLIPSKRAEPRRDLFLLRVDALAALGRYAELEPALESENSNLDPIYQHMFLAVVRSKLGEGKASANEWQRALDVADIPQKLLLIAQYAEENGAPEVATAACDQVLVTQPRLHSAHVARLRLAEKMGQTVNAQHIADEILQIWPDDVATGVRGIYLRLLMGLSGAEAINAEKELEKLVPDGHRDLNTAAVLALARLRSGRAAEALTAFNGTPPPPSASPGVTAVHAAVLAANGWAEEARTEAERLSTARLMPEERALIRPILEASDRATARN